MKHIIAIVILLSVVASSYGQKSAIGVKLGGTSGISVKFPYYEAPGKIEIIVGGAWDGLQVLGLYEIYAQAFEVEGLSWYYGAGAHVGFWEGRKGNRFENRSPFVGIGVDGVLGMVYQIQEIPIEVSFDMIPAINLIGYTGVWLDGGIGIRYTF